jgi:hypothetical protein
MLREKRKPQSYFDGYVAVMDGLIADMEAALDRPRDEEHRQFLLYSAFLYRLERWIMRYSQGQPLDVLRTDLQRIWPALERWRTETGPEGRFDLGVKSEYVTCLWLLSISLLLEDEPDRLGWLVETCETAGRDRLLDGLTSARLGGPISDDLLFPQPFGPLVQALEDRDPKSLATYLKSYLKGMRGCYWHGRHKSDDSQFFGYWSFEAAAVARLAECGAGPFLDSEYFPADLLP